MELKPFLMSLSMADRKAFALRCGTSLGHLNNIASGYNNKTCSTELAVAIERESKKVVTRPELCPESWTARWPELVMRMRRRPSTNAVKG